MATILFWNINKKQLINDREKRLLTENETLLSTYSDHLPIVITLEIERMVNHEH